MVDTYAERSELGWTVRRRRMVEGVNPAKNKTTDGDFSPSVSVFLKNYCFFALQYSRGETPKCCLKALEKWNRSS